MSAGLPQEGGGDQPQFIAELSANLVQRSSIHENYAQDIIITTEDKLWRCLQTYLKNVESRNAWIAPAGVLIPIVATFVGADFRDFLLSKYFWQALFVCAAIASTVWLVASLAKARNAESLDDVVRRIKTGSVPANITLTESIQANAQMSESSPT